MKRNTTVYTLGAKLFSFFLCGVCVLFLALLMLNGALQKAQMFLAAACVLAVAANYVWNVNFRQVGSVDATTKRISTPYTLANKLFPFRFGGFCAFFFIFLLMSGLIQKAPLFLVVPGVIAVASYYSWKKNFRDLIESLAQLKFTTTCQIQSTNYWSKPIAEKLWHYTSIPASLTCTLRALNDS
jgi:hypothetical protein